MKLRAQKSVFKVKKIGDPLKKLAQLFAQKSANEQRQISRFLGAKNEAGHFGIRQ